MRVLCVLLLVALSAVASPVVQADVHESQVRAVTAPSENRTIDDRASGVLTPEQIQRLRFAVRLIELGQIERAYREVERVRHQVHDYETVRELYLAGRDLQIGTAATVNKALVRLQALLAGRGYYMRAERTWENQNEPIQTVALVEFPFWDDNGHMQYETVRYPVTIDVADLAPLRLGERETFLVEGWVHGFNASKLTVVVQAELAYHSYVEAQITGNTYLTPGFTFALTHGGRIKNLPPATIKDAAVAFTTPAEPFTLGFEDFAAAENEEAASAYKFEIRRRIFLGKDRLVARGVVPAPGQGDPTIVITADSSFAQGNDEYFKAGKKYRITLQLKREGSSYYTDAWSPALRFDFVWRDGVDRLALVEGDEQGRAVERGNRFHHLHGGEVR